jgi:hypothetical protein
MVLDVTPTKGRRFKIKKWNGRKYIDLKHPWTQEDIRAIQVARKMLNLAGQGISDIGDIIAIANKPRRSSRRGMRKPPTGHGPFAKDASMAKNARDR